MKTYEELLKRINYIDELIKFHKNELECLWKIFHMQNNSIADKIESVQFGEALRKLQNEIQWFENDCLETIKNIDDKRFNDMKKFIDMERKLERISSILNEK